jgi:AcrR family transcriptional regulator
MNTTPDPTCPLPALGTDDDAAPQRRRRKEARPGELLSAALDLFVEKGYAATRLDDVAARAGVSKGTLYLYFDSKEALFRAVIQEGVLPTLEVGEAMLAENTGSARDLLRCLLLGWWELTGSTRFGGIPKLMLSEATNFPEVAQYYNDAVIERGRALLREALQRGIASGEFRPVDVELAISTIFAPVLMLAVWRHSMVVCGCAAEDPERYLDTHIDLILNGLAPR